MTHRHTEGFDGFADDYSKLPTTGKFRYIGASNPTGFHISATNSRWNDGIDTNPGKGIVCGTGTSAALNIGSVDGVVAFNFPGDSGSGNNTLIRFSVRTPASGTKAPICAFVDSGGRFVNGLFLTALGYLQWVKYDSGSTPAIVVATAEAPLGTSVWMTLDIEHCNDSGSQHLLVKVDDETYLSLSSGQNTDPWTDFVIGTCFDPTALSAFWLSPSGVAYDDLLGLTDDSSGITAMPDDLTRIETLFPTSLDASSTGFTSTGGTTVADRLGKDSNDADTSYYAGSFVNDKLTVDSTETLSLSPDSIAWVAVASVSRKSGVSSRKIKQQLRISSTDYAGSTEFSQFTTYGLYSEAWDENPANTNPWSKSSVEAALWGQKVTT